MQSRTDVQPARRRQRGFTLIEVLVAVAVLGLAMGAVLASSGQYADNAIYLRDKTFASWVGHNLLNEWHIENEWPDTGTRDGEAEMAGRDWYWVAEVSKTPDPTIRRVDLSISLEEGDDAPSLVTMSGFLAEPQ